MIRSLDIAKEPRQQMAGFTLVELLISMAIVGVVLGSIYSLFISQSRNAAVQEQVTSVQQNLRAAIYFMERELRMAGYNPTGVTAGGVGEDIDCNGTSDPSQSDNSATLMTDESESIGLKNVQTGTLTFTQDLNGDGDTCDGDESIVYALNGLMLERNSAPIAENIEAIYFEYLDADGTVVTSIGNIRQVVITVVGRTARSDADYSDNNTYQSLLGTTVFTVPSSARHYRRRLLSTQVDCRNISP